MVIPADDAGTHGTFRQIKETNVEFGVPAGEILVISFATV